MAHRNQNGPGGPGMIVGNGGDGSYVSAEMMKQVDTPVETLLGTVNGALSGAALGVGASTLVSWGGAAAKEEGLVTATLNNLKGKHKWPVVAATAALGALGAVVRFSRARQHNNWSDRHYEFLQQQQQSHVDRVSDHGEKDGHSR